MQFYAGMDPNGVPQIFSSTTSHPQAGQADGLVPAQTPPPWLQPAPTLQCPPHPGTAPAFNFPPTTITPMFPPPPPHLLNMNNSGGSNPNTESLPVVSSAPPTSFK